MASLRKLELKQLLAHLQGEGPPLVIAGSRGSGKTTLCKGLWELVQEEE